MSSVGISEAEKAEILRLCAAILYLGNITFTEDDKEQAQIHDKDSTLPWAERRNSSRSFVVFWAHACCSARLVCTPDAVRAGECASCIVLSHNHVWKQAGIRLRLPSECRRGALVGKSNRLWSWCDAVATPMSYAAVVQGSGE